MAYGYGKTLSPDKEPDSQTQYLHFRNSETFDEKLAGMEKQGWVFKEKNPSKSPATFAACLDPHETGRV